jgi:Bacterial PH domain
MAGDDLTGEVTLRAGFGRVLTIVTVLIAVGAVGSVALTGDAAAAADVAGVATLVAYTCWLLFWQPSVRIDDAGVRLENIARTIDIPWSAISRIDTRWALELTTPTGAYTAWAAPAPGRSTAARVHASDVRNLPESTYVARAVRPGDVPNTPSGDAAAIIRLRWEALRDSGALPAAGESSQKPVVRFHVVRLAILAVLVVATVLIALV